MKKNQFLKTAAVAVPAVALALFATGAASVAAVQADEDTVTSNRSSDQRRERPELSEEQKAKMEDLREAIESNDYDAFIDLVADTQFADVIDNEDDFDKLVEANELRESGDTEAAREIIKELGIPPFGFGGPHGERGARPELTDEQKEEREAHRAAVVAAFEAGDYEAFLEATADAPKRENAPEITEDIFEKLAEAHSLRKSGDTEGAKAIMDDLGFKPHRQAPVK